MLGSGSQSDEGEASRITPRMFLSVIRGTGTEHERELVRQAFDDPNSELHDWLEGVQEWAERTLGRKHAASEAGDRILEEATARQHRQDLVSFAARKRGESVLSEEQFSSVLAAGAMSADSDKTATAADYVAAIQAMRSRLLAFCPTLAQDIDRLLSPGGRDTPGT